jgi:ribose transport system permease protein
MSSQIDEAQQAAPTSQPADHRWQSVARRVLDTVGVQNVSLLVALALLVTLIGVQNNKLFLVANIRVIGTSVAILGIVAVAQTVVMLIGGLDISVGSMAGLASVASAMVFTATGQAGVGILVALGIGVVAGLFNAIVIVYGRVNAVIATLATFAAYRGLADLISNGSAQGYTGADNTFTFLGQGSLLGIPTLLWVLAVVALVVHFLLRYTDIGRNLYAIGGNSAAARLAGINLNRYIIAVYILVGFIAAVAGVLLTARTGSGQPTSGSQGLELQSITAAALGGAALRGGKGTVTGTILAVLLLGVLVNGLTILDVNSFWQDVAQGALLIIAVVIQQRRRGTRAVGLPT